MNPRFVAGNRVELLESGAQYFPALIAAIDAAAAEIHLQTYIFENDATGRAVSAALACAVRRGVVVRVLVDGFGAREFPAMLGAELLAAGVEVLVYRAEIAPLRLRRHRLRRLHRKVAVIDGRVAFVGGINIIDDWDMGTTPEQIPPRYDYAVRIEGPLLASIHASTRHIWQTVRWARLHRRLPEPPRRPPDDTPRGDMRATFVIRDNLRHRRDIEEAYLDAIGAARREVLIANAYFLPGRRFRHALAEATRRGVRVTVLLQGRVEYRLLYHATQALYGALLGGGVRIFEYHTSFLHAKVAVVDGAWSTVGSSNIDPFSLLLAREANVIITDARFGDELRASLRRAMDNGAREVRHEDWRDAPLAMRIARWLAYGLVRLAMGIVGYGRRDYGK
ncbi:MAG: cardiolipin synthase ClsB [Sulfurisoma sp.]|nr:cardiolipin synthase ClsB [Sulfurisoma sp.]